ncbi:hypothetical protein OGR47_17210 [Methylocystis sp. MJC1]|jgi:hypothetical protein|uniref:hypothetical protein n=1 Tax=Methylocystis sp. MJC1 TaxID=2654282 RepID=UPI0013EB0CA3|nr:hypothetical protein [Methylocystis sp. MJC1]KAF2990703.1 hypothetical protein MJC1_02127 [Methylocystis sp. MJC1]MBU6528697.1 hypothetical protein [Methylocystis sp. MJC1]UZX11586.1 hypothetical protein OGR47_17210 [Methylocystis sp. MJC1]
MLIKFQRRLCAFLAIPIVVCFSAGHAARAQQAINPTVLAPSSGNALPHGTMQTAPSNARAGGQPTIVRPHPDAKWQTAIPAHRRHRHYKPFRDE